MKRVIALTATLACALALTACEGEPSGTTKQVVPKDATELVYNLGTEPETLDPVKSSGIPESIVILNCIDTLVTIDDAGRTVPALAESWDVSDDGLTYTFHLREAEWTNGDAVTAGQFVDTWLRALAPETAAQYAYMLYTVAGAEEYNTGKVDDPSTVGLGAPEPRRLIVKLEAPTPHFPSMLAHSTYAPFHRDTVKAGPREWRVNPETYVGCGPFRIAEFKSHNRIVLEKNPTYWDADAVSLERIVMLMIEQESTALAAFEAGQIDVMQRPPLPAVKKLKKDGRLQSAPQIGTYYISFNCEKAPFDDARVRRAFTMAVDRRTITEKITQMGEKPALAFVPFGIADIEGDFREVGGDLAVDGDFDEARRLLAEAGYPGGKGLPAISYLYNTKEMHKVIASELQYRWKKELGVEVELRNTEWKVYLRAKRDGDYQIGRGGWIGDYPDPMTFLDTFITASGNNNSHWSNARYDELITGARLEDDPAKRMGMLHEAESVLMKDLPIAPLYFYVDPFLEKPGVSGIVRTPLGYRYFKRANVE